MIQQADDNSIQFRIFYSELFRPFEEIFHYHCKKFVCISERIHSEEFIIRINMDALPFSVVNKRVAMPLPKSYPRELKTIGDHIRKRRMDLSLLQKEVSGILGVTEECFGLWELGKDAPRIKYMPKSIAFLGVMMMDKRKEWTRKEFLLLSDRKHGAYD